MNHKMDFGEIIMNSIDLNYNLFSLLYVDQSQKNLNINLKRTKTSPIDIYINCGRLLAASCRYFGISYAIVTNEPDYLRERVEALGGGVNVVGSNFDRDVPKGASFYTAHYKLDLLREFGNGTFGDRVGLIDIDTVLTKPFKIEPSLWRDNTLFVYDLSDSVKSSYGEQTILKSLTTLGYPRSQTAQWYGGEFIMGTSVGFRSLSNVVDYYWPAYKTHYKTLHHNGDEVIVTAAILTLQEENRKMQLFDAGGAESVNAYPLVARWWTARTGFKQESYKSASKAALIHLPADKSFLARMSEKSYSPDEFMKSFRSYARSRLLVRKLVNPFLNLKTSEKKFVGSLN